MVQAIYHAPKGDDQVVTTRGVRFFDGQAVELDPVEHAVLISKLVNNQHFEVIGADEVEETEEPEAVLAGLVAEHVGFGRYVIKRDGETIREGLTKTDAATFNAMSDEDKAEYVDL